MPRTPNSDRLESGDVDILQKLGLVGKRPSSGTRSTLSGVIPFKSGVILTQWVRIEVPVTSVVPVPLSTEFSLIFSICSHRVNNAFLFTIVSKRKRLQLGVQFIPGKIVVYVGQKNSVYFEYDIHNGQWHNLALGIQPQRVTLYTSCGKASVHANLHFKNEETLDPEGSFLLGKMSQNSVQFEGAICQFDLHPSAKAAHNYCKYIKKQCREADTYRANLPPLLPLLQQDPNISFTLRTPMTITELISKGFTPTLSQDKTRINAEISGGPNKSIQTTSQLGSLSLPVHGTVLPRLFRPTLQIPTKAKTQTVTTLLRTRASPKFHKPTEQSSPKKGITIKPHKIKDTYMPVTATQKKLEIVQPSAVTKPYSILPNSKRQLTTTAVKRSVPEVSTLRYSKSNSFVPVTPATIDGLQTFDLEPTQFSLLMGPPGSKGEPGPTVNYYN
ncbi:collagen alpha-1(XXVII) chain B isoform X1 [Silurus meridionalis]|nr:collagen alpha-1(XXVII) chain B isoform X1 [Silurus meridionalis]